MMGPGPDPAVTSPSPEAPAGYLHRESVEQQQQQQEHRVRQRADPERISVGARSNPPSLQSLGGGGGGGSGGGSGVQQAQQQQLQQQQMILPTRQHDVRQVSSWGKGREEHEKGKAPCFANPRPDSANDPNTVHSKERYAGSGGGGREREPAPGASDPRNNLLLHLQPLQPQGGSRLPSRDSLMATPNNHGQQRRQQYQQHQHQQHQHQQQHQHPQQRLQAPRQQDQRQPPQQQNLRRDRPLSSAPRSFAQADSGRAAGPVPARRTPGERPIDNGGQFTAGKLTPQAATTAAAAADAVAVRAVVPAGPSSPIIAALQATDKTIKPPPLAVRSGALTIRPKCPECDDLVRAGLHEPTVLCEDRHCDRSVFAGEEQQEEEEEEEAGGARRAVSPWRLRNKTRTGNIGIILCLNIGACAFSIFVVCSSRFFGRVHTCDADRRFFASAFFPH